MSCSTNSLFLAICFHSLVHLALSLVQTALLIASEQGELAAVKTLLAARADIEATDVGNQARTWLRYQSLFLPPTFVLSAGFAYLRASARCTLFCC